MLIASAPRCRKRSIETVPSCPDLASRCSLRFVHSDGSSRAQGHSFATWHLGCRIVSPTRKVRTEPTQHAIEIDDFPAALFELGEHQGSVSQDLAVLDLRVVCESAANPLQGRVEAAFVFDTRRTE